MNSESFVQRLPQLLAEKLPGAEAQYRMAPQHRHRLTANADLSALKPSAVMILLCRKSSGSWFVPLIERPQYNGAHSAQISLPGGKTDPSDLNLQATALRECFEEIGLNDVKVLGALTPLHIPVSGFLVHPFVGVCDQTEPAMLADEREVKSVLELKLDDLYNNDLIENGIIELPGKIKIEAPWFNVQGHRVWGATAMILSEFKALL